MSITSSLSGSQGKPASKPIVLLVDDVRSTRDRVARVLVTGGFDTLEAADGREALRVLANSPKVDAILLDLLMSGMNGWEFRELQLRNAHLASIPTLVVTVKALGEHERYALRLANATLIQKPFEDGQLLQVVSEMLTTERARTSAGDARWLTEDGHPLFWSRQGRVACEKHAPERGTDQWNREGWAWIPSFAGKNKIQYCCQECEGGPIRHHRVVLDAEVAASVPEAPAPQRSASPPSPQH